MQMQPWRKEGGKQVSTVSAGHTWDGEGAEGAGSDVSPGDEADSVTKALIESSETRPDPKDRYLRSVPWDRQCWLEARRPFLEGAPQRATGRSVIKTFPFPQLALRNVMAACGCTETLNPIQVL